ncbi:hypothetical protein ELS24_03670 [Achromobacter spanius]|nr:hypothetical protein ELS24_03670 [Achromobacter spanius]
MNPYITNTTNGHVHIDRIRVKGSLAHRPLGKLWFQLMGDTGELVPIAASARKPRGASYGPADQVWMKSRDIRGIDRAHQIELDCCPPQILQRHNFFGHANLQSYVHQIFEQQTTAMALSPTDEERAEWANGQVGITEIHLTANFWCPPVQREIIDAIDANNREGKRRNRETSIELGHGPKRRSVYHSATVYSKHELLASQWKNPGEYQTAILDLARLSIRVEIKLHHQGLRTRNLQYVSRWKHEDVDKLFFDLLGRYKITNSVQPVLTEYEAKELPKNVRRAYLLWLNGENLHEHFNRTTVWQHAKELKQRVGIDITGHRRPEALPVVNTAEIFTRENIVPIPEWAYGSQRYSPPV